MQSYLLIGLFLLGLLVKIKFPNLLKYRNILNKFLIYAGLPVLVFVSFSDAKDIPLIEYLGFSIFIVLFMMTMMYFIVNRFKIDSKSKASLFLCSAFGNTAYFGIPISFALFGERGSSIAALLSLVTMLIHYTLGLILARGIVSKRKTIFEKLRNPLPWIFIFVAILSQFDITVPGFLHHIGALGSFIAIFVIGSSLRLQYVNKRVFNYNLLKMLAWPIVTFVFLLLFGIKDIFPFLMLAAAPSAFLNASLALEFKFNEELASGIITIGSILYVILFLGLDLFFF